VCDFCHAPLEESLWSPHGRRADMVPLPVVRAPLPPVPAGAEDEHERLLRTLQGAS